MIWERRTVEQVTKITVWFGLFTVAQRRGEHIIAWTDLILFGLKFRIGRSVS